MFDKNQKLIPVNMLSAGEKQIYAISVLWALAKISGRALPMIIDTPLGRLDVHHRDQLVKTSFPKRVIKLLFFPLIQKFIKIILIKCENILLTLTALILIFKRDIQIFIKAIFFQIRFLWVVYNDNK